MAEVLLADRLRERSIDADVSSAGLLYDGRAASGPAVEVMDDRGIDLAGHRSRRITAEMLADADLVLGMARQHVREAVVLSPAGFTRTFTLKELVRRGEQMGGRGAEDTPGAWIARAGIGRKPSEHLGDSTADDVEDPIGQRREVYEVTARELDDLVLRLVDLLWGPVGARGCEDALA